MIKPGLTHTSRLTVTEGDTAARHGSGDMAVLATPALVALMENAAMQAVAPYLPEGATTVGSLISTSHLRPSAVGAVVTATARLTAVSDRRLEFAVEAHEGDTLIGEGTHVRYVVDRVRFLSRLSAKS